MIITIQLAKTITFLKSSFYQTTIEETAMSVTFVLKIADKEKITIFYFREIKK